MLKEIENVRQREGEPLRRWFTDRDLDLIVWFQEDMSVHGFQLCYDKRRDEHALTWTVADGYAHERVDKGDWATFKPIPILVDEAHLSPYDLAERFRHRSRDMDRGIAELVYCRLLDYVREGKREG